LNFSDDAGFRFSYRKSKQTDKKFGLIETEGPLTDDRKSFRNLADDFSIPPGTQVVVAADQSTEDGSIKKSGSVGVVTKAPSHNGLPYLVRFADETEIEVSFKDLVLRRREIENILQMPTDDDLTQFVIYKCQVGSKAFGLSNADSDDDIRGIYLPPADRHWSMYALPEQLEIMDGNQDVVYWEIEKFFKLALKANPNILETLWTPLVLEISSIGEKVRANRTAFLSNHLYKTYSGYVLSQFRRMKNAFESKGKYKPKHAMHLVRLLYSGIGALDSGEIMIDVSQYRQQLMEIRNGELSFEEVRKLALGLDRKFQTAFESTKLPDQPDFETVNNLLIEARRSVTNK
jgi:predicted nucleotidyltransferase